MSDLIERDAVLALIENALRFHGDAPAYVADLADEISMIPAATVTGTKPSIDWSHVAPHFRAMAADENGDTYLYEGRPKPCGGEWDTQKNIACASHFASFTPGTCDWRESLVMRPGYEEAGE